MAGFIMVIALMWVACAIASGVIASGKGLQPEGYFFGGLLLGVLGLLIAVCAQPRLPAGAPGWYETDEPGLLQYWDGSQWIASQQS